MKLPGEEASVRSAAAQPWPCATARTRCHASRRRQGQGRDREKCMGAEANTPLCSFHPRPGSRHGDPAAEHGCRRDNHLASLRTCIKTWGFIGLRVRMNMPADRATIRRDFTTLTCVRYSEYAETWCEATQQGVFVVFAHAPVPMRKAGWMRGLREVLSFQALWRFKDARQTSAQGRCGEREV